MSKALSTIIYVTVVSKKTVGIDLMSVTLTDFELKLDDNLNAYIQTPRTEKVWTTLGSEFGKDAIKTAAVVRVLYGLKSAGATFRSHLARCMESLGYVSCKVDPNLWLKPKIRPLDGLYYYS